MDTGYNVGIPREEQGHKTSFSIETQQIQTFRVIIIQHHNLTQPQINPKQQPTWKQEKQDRTLSSSIHPCPVHVQSSPVQYTPLFPIQPNSTPPPSMQKHSPKENPFMYTGCMVEEARGRRPQHRPTVEPRNRTVNHRTSILRSRKRMRMQDRCLLTVTVTVTVTVLVLACMHCTALHVCMHMYMCVCVSGKRLLGTDFTSIADNPGAGSCRVKSRG
ncbi:hypothetical protein BO86DRAFT_378594 [Aspergillus japonicus CBS 114.51]|uniref:Uncharacterized protein n=1 Tax=Aspergillus japonicus CBS 114.51 TaxID=1448312 RepID=A0A8T8X4A4_ASPJA|nr:hypothetical protein BO86DRAFT_378594 [Aspergillus japonicus CBS 114.51]RAH82784.1 hypothetical protein BO86DRAFT_378594 [Aspergillus japonicus CBS 114.51]